MLFRSDEGPAVCEKQRERREEYVNGRGDEKIKGLKSDRRGKDVGVDCRVRIRVRERKQIKKET